MDKDRNDIDAYFHELLTKAVGFRVPTPRQSDIGWEDLTPEKMEFTAQKYYEITLPEMLFWTTENAKSEDQSRKAKRMSLARDLSVQARDLTPVLVREKYQVERIDYDNHKLDKDIVNIKINHGYWEQIYVVQYDGYDENIMRASRKSVFTKMYGTSRFQDALLLLAKASAKIENNTLSFCGVDFGFSFGSGDNWHNDWLDRSPNEKPFNNPVPKGAYAGSQLFFSELAPTQLRVALVDGAFPKKSLLSGNLNTLLQRTAKASDSVIFCVPPHLKNTRLKHVDHSKQSTLLVSRQHVHHAWPLILSELSRPILQKLARGETVTVIVQAAVFSAMLGLYLRNAKRDLGLEGRLFFFDLGQSLDVVAPENAGGWVARQKDDISGIEPSLIPFETMVS